MKVDEAVAGTSCYGSPLSLSWEKVRLCKVHGFLKSLYAEPKFCMIGSKNAPVHNLQFRVATTVESGRRAGLLERPY